MGRAGPLVEGKTKTSPEWNSLVNVRKGFIKQKKLPLALGRSEKSPKNNVFAVELFTTLHQDKNI